MRLVLLLVLAVVSCAAPSERLIRLKSPLPAAKITPPNFPPIDNTAAPDQLPISLLQLRSRQEPATPLPVAVSAEAPAAPATPATPATPAAAAPAAPAGGEAAAATAQGEAPGKLTPGADCSELLDCEACVGPQACLWDHDTGICVEKLATNLGPNAAFSCDPDPEVRANWRKTHPAPVDPTDADTSKTGEPEVDAEDVGKPPQLPVPPKVQVVEADVVPEPTTAPETACPVASETPAPSTTEPVASPEAEATSPPAETAAPSDAAAPPAETAPAETAPAESAPAEPTPALPAAEEAALAHQIREMHASLTNEIRQVRDELRAEIRAALPAGTPAAEA